VACWHPLRPQRVASDEFRHYLPSLRARPRGPRGQGAQGLILPAVKNVVISADIEEFDAIVPVEP